MSTVDKLIKRALRTIGVYQSGESLTAEEYVDALGVLNSMLDLWANDRLLGPFKTRVSRVLTAGDGTYTIGPAGEIVTNKPVRIDSIFLRDGTLDTEMQQIDLLQYNDIDYKTTQGKPVRYFYDPKPHVGAPVISPEPGTIYLDPVPDAAYTIFIDVWYQFTTYSNVADALNVQSGMEEAMAYNLAMRLALEYGKVVTPELKRFASESLRKIKMTNSLDIPLVQTWYKRDYSIQAGF